MLHTDTARNNRRLNPAGLVRSFISERPQAFGTICAFTATLAWSFNFIAGRALSETIQPMTLVAARSLIAFLIFLPFALSHLKREWPVIRTRLKFCALAGLIGLTIPNTCIYWASHTSAAINLSIIAISTPLFVLIMARVFFSERLTPSRILGLFIIICGILLLISRGDLSVLANLKFQKGDLIMLGNVLGFAAYTLMLRKAPSGISSIAMMAVLLFFAALFALPGAIWEHAAGARIVLSWKLFWGLLYVSLGSSIVAYFAWNLAVACAGSARSSIIYYMLPVFSGIEAFIFLGEAITLVHILSMGLIVSGLLLAIHVKKKLLPD